MSIAPMPWLNLLYGLQNVLFSSIHALSNSALHESRRKNVACIRKKIYGDLYLKRALFYVFAIFIFTYFLQLGTIIVSTHCYLAIPYCWIFFLYFFFLVALESRCPWCYVEWCCLTFIIIRKTSHKNYYYYYHCCYSCYYWPSSRWTASTRHVAKHVSVA